MAGKFAAGFAGRALFQKTRIPDIPILLGIGVLLGPVLHLVETPMLIPLAPYIGTLALLVIMLEGGMSLDVDRVLRQMKWAFLLTVAAFLFAVAGIAAAFHGITGAPVPQSLLIGAILGCTSGAIVIPLVQEMRMAQNTRTILTLEAALGDALAVVSVLFLIQYIHAPSLSLGRQIAMTANAFWWGGCSGRSGGSSGCGSWRGWAGCRWPTCSRWPRSCSSTPPPRRSTPAGSSRCWSSGWRSRTRRLW